VIWGWIRRKPLASVSEFIDSQRARAGRLPGQGVLVVLEGIDGAGKSTQLRRLAGVLAGLGLGVVSDREPTDGPHGSRLRASATAGRLGPEEELTLFIADRRQHVAEVIQPGLNSGKVILLDRYYFSNAAYQGSRGLDWEDIIRVNETFAPRPDLLLWLDLPPEASAERIQGRGMTVNAFEQHEHLVRCRDIFSRIHLPEMRRIDATETSDRVFAVILCEVLLLLMARWAASENVPAMERLEWVRRLLGLIPPGADRPTVR